MSKLTTQNNKLSHYYRAAWPFSPSCSLFDMLLDNIEDYYINTDTPNVIKLEIPLPGFDVSQIGVELDGDNYLSIFAKNDKGSFKRSYELSYRNLDTDNIEASLKNGILTISIPKIYKKQEDKKVISIKSS